MSLLPTESDAGTRYLFAGVCFDPAAFRLLVDGVERPVQPLALRLLQVLCEEHGRAVSRRELFERLWPRQSVADESLIQQTAKLREALGPYATCIVTVRKVGLRLDAPLQRVEVAPPPQQMEAPAPATAVQPMAAPAARALRSARWRYWRWLLPLVAGACLWYALQTDPQAPVPGGAGLLEADLASEKPSTADALRRALQLDATGQRDEALVLLKILHEADAASPLPPLYLAWIEQARGNGTESAHWAGLARERLGDRPAERLRLLLHQVERERKPPDEESFAVLNLMAGEHGAVPATRLAKAHALLGRNARDEARAELLALDWDGLDLVNAPVALGDLAALGAVEEAERQYQLLRARLDAALRGEIDARLAAARADYTAADQAVRAALASGPSERAQIRLHMLLALYATEAGDAAAASQDFAALEARGALASTSMLGFNLLLLQAGAPQTAAADAATMLARAAAMVPALTYPGGCWEVEALAALRRLPTVPACPAGAIGAEAVPGLPALRQALESYRRGEDAAAAATLAQARREGIEATLYAAHAQALGHLLDAAQAPPLPVEPPYPVWSRHSARWLALRARH